MSPPTPYSDRAPVIEVPDNVADVGRRLDKVEFDLRFAASRQATLAYTPGMPPLPPYVDHSVHLTYVRHQGAYGCGLNAFAAYWDIAITKYCAPYHHPNISVNRTLWAWHWPLTCVPENLPCAQRQQAKIPGPDGKLYDTEEQYFNAVGCPTEGTELTNSDAVQWPTDVGNLECPNFRLDCHPLANAGKFSHDVKVELNELKYWLNGGPVRAGVWGNHFVTLVGFDDQSQRLKFINSWGDRWGENGFGYVDYDRVGDDINSAQVYQFVPPQAVPCARVRFTSQWRQDVHVWIGVEGTTMSKRIWPSGQRQDNSHDLWFTVTLPQGFNWPPSPENRVFLDVYDTGAHSNAGGEIAEFSVFFGDEFRFCTEILQHAPDPGTPGPGGIVPKPFGPRELVHVTIP